jgi:hypothetical protein
MGFIRNYWIEGNGNLSGCFEIYLPWSADYDYSQILCVHWDDVLVYDNPDEEGCWIMYVSTNEPSVEQMTVYPNPARGEINLRMGEHEIENISIYNTRTNNFSGDSVIQTDSFPVGNYFGLARLEGGSIRRIRFQEI